MSFAFEPVQLGAACDVLDRASLEAAGQEVEVAFGPAAAFVTGAVIPVDGGFAAYSGV